MRSSALLHLSRYGWFMLIGVAFAAKDACAGGGRRPEPAPPAPSSAPASPPKSSSASEPAPSTPAHRNERRVPS